MQVNLGSPSRRRAPRPWRARTEAPNPPPTASEASAPVRARQRARGPPSSLADRSEPPSPLTTLGRSIRKGAARYRPLPLGPRPHQCNARIGVALRPVQALAARPRSGKPCRKGLPRAMDAEGRFGSPRTVALAGIGTQMQRPGRAATPEKAVTRHPAPRALKAPEIRWHRTKCGSLQLSACASSPGYEWRTVLSTRVQSGQGMEPRVASTP